MPAVFQALRIRPACSRLPRRGRRASWFHTVRRMDEYYRDDKLKRKARYLLEQATLNDPQGPLEKCNERFKVRSNTSFHMYVSQSPCKFILPRFLMISTLISFIES